MSLTQALTAAMSGLRVTQSGLALVAANVANADTPGYVRKTAVQITSAAGDLFHRRDPVAVLGERLKGRVEDLRPGFRAGHRASWIECRFKLNEYSIKGPSFVKLASGERARHQEDQQQP